MEVTETPVVTNLITLTNESLFMARRKATYELEHEEHETHFIQPKKAPPRQGIRLLNDAQREAWRTIDEHRISFITGASGAGKSQVAFGYAAEKTHKGEFDKVIVTRPIIEAAGESMGYLKGEVSEKVAPYLAPALVVARKAGYEVDVEFLAIGFMRGHTFEDVIVVVEEAQNCSVAQLRLILSRLGPGCKLVLAGDTEQLDVRDSGLARTMAVLQEVEDIGFFEFQEEHIVRDPLIGVILRHMKPLF